MKFEQELSGDKIEISGQNEVNKSEVFIGTMKLYPGTFYWQLDLMTLKISKAELTEERVEVLEEINPVTNRGTGKLINVKKRDLVSKDNHWYTVAYNWKSAKTKFLKRLKNETQKNILNSQKESDQ